MKKILILLFVLITKLLISQSNNNFDSNEYLSQDDVLYKKSKKSEFLRILVTSNNNILVSTRFKKINQVRELRPIIINFIKEKKYDSHIIISITSKSNKLNINNDIVNLATSCFKKQLISTKKGVIFFNPKNFTNDENFDKKKQT